MQDDVWHRDLFAALWRNRSSAAAAAAAVEAAVLRHSAAAGADAAAATAAAAGRKAAELLNKYGSLPAARKCSDVATHVRSLLACSNAAFVTVCS